ncbi:VWA domain-containing protein [Aciditerrimonas ferrireducens]|jgi:uncharacterized protein with von Willebrand factor type A (vWA) domain|uniref:VWA domain-containing protein n=1 Tax=Aciditerrimonas ferrireducens TaxID=667306 RepID=A0ABV6C4I2_9ACTN|nr:VWA domain-containing protein [Aciditerrimonas ferrireducens]MCK4177464.1 VWA domain-containing protein [Aciditerrimonas ferrireducens]
MLDVLTGFLEELRAAGVPVSLAEATDAARAVQVVPAADRAAFHQALAATLVKSPSHLPAFETAFAVYFAPRGAGVLGEDEGSEPEAASPNRGAASMGAPGDGGGPGAAQRPEDLAAALVRALLAGDQAAVAELARQAVARLSGMEPGRPVGGTYYLYRTLRQLDLASIEAQLLEALAGQAGQPTDGLRRRLLEDEVAERIEALRRAVQDEIRRLLVADRGAQALHRSVRQPLLEQVDFMHASAEELRALHRAIAPLSRRLAVRLARRRRQGREGRLDVRATLRASLSSGGVPVALHWRPPRPAKPELMVVADVSGSVASFARFTLLLLHALASQFSRVRSFVFIDGIDEVTDLLDRTEDPAEAARRVTTEADVVWLDGHSDYGHALTVFQERWGAEVSARTSLLILGDARSNYHTPEAEVLADLAARARHVYWLNPEPRAYWGTGDSVVGAYAPYCDQVVEVRNLAQLERFVADLA